VIPYANRLIRRPLREGRSWVRIEPCDASHPRPGRPVRTSRNTPFRGWRDHDSLTVLARGGLDAAAWVFDLDDRYPRLSENGDPRVKLAALIDFEAFRLRLAATLKRPDASKGGRPPYDQVIMFKILVLQTLYTLSDDATEFQIRDRLSFMRFLDLGFEDPVPDAKTVWLFREHLTNPHRRRRSVVRRSRSESAFHRGSHRLLCCCSWHL